MGVKFQVIKCGRCGKPRGLLHTCITRADTARKPGKTRIKPKLEVTRRPCRRCGKPGGLTHTCKVTTDFKRRKAAAERQAAAEAKKQKAAQRKAAAEQASARRRAAAAAKRHATADHARRTQATRRTAKPTPKPTHDYRTCTDTECRRYACLAWKEALSEGRASGLEDGYEHGYEIGYAEGRATK